jgi:hypothetical protein
VFCYVALETVIVTASDDSNENELERICSCSLVRNSLVVFWGRGD